MTDRSNPSVLAAFDKFRLTATAIDLCEAVASAAWERGWDSDVAPVADGGEGTLEALAAQGGSFRTTTVSGPLGDPVDAVWLWRNTTAFIEMARASGLALVGGPDGNDALDASTFGTGELMVAALNSGAKRIVVTVGGSATTDGGFGALRAIEPLVRFRGIRLEVACDVETVFVDAARDFGPQKGATPSQVELLTRRLERLAGLFYEERGVDVRSIAGTGAAGGLAGALVSVGASLVSGFSLVADEISLGERMTNSSLVITGEGFFDEESFHGKVVGGVCAMAKAAGLPVVVMCGGRQAGLEIPAEFADTVVEVITLSERFGKEKAWNEPVACVREVASEVLEKWALPGA